MKVSKKLLSTLTIREREVLKLFSRGLTNHEIAGALGLTDHSIKKYHMPNIYKKFGLYDKDDGRFGGPLKGRKLMAMIAGVTVG